jgi:hypothetical protein
MSRVWRAWPAGPRGARDAPHVGEVLRWADALVCVLTAAYVASTWCTAELVNVEEQPKPPGFPDLPGRSYFAYASWWMPCLEARRLD